MRLFYQPLINSDQLYLNADESRHCIKVLRLKLTDRIKVIDGTGNCFQCEITKADSKRCEFIIQDQFEYTDKSYAIHIAIAPTKNLDRLEWFVEKAVEFGIDKISPILCDQSERRNVKTDRLIRKAVSAMKQSLHYKLPEIGEMMSFENLLKTSREPQKYIAYVDGNNPNYLKNEALKNNDYLVLIGPEGDFSQQEIKLAIAHDFTPVSLGSNRLRTETAGIAACHILNLIND